MVDWIRCDEPRIGTRKLKDRLEKQGKKIGRKRLFDVLRKHNRLVKPKKSYKKTTYSRHEYAVAPNLIKSMSVAAPKQILVSDITYLSLSGSRHAYLFLVSDLYSRKIVGFHLSRDLSHYSALLALDNAVKLMGDVQGTIHHSDRGCQYCCHEYLKYLRQKYMRSSMTDESHCYQNAVAERINGILKGDLVLDQTFTSFQEANKAVARAIRIYNTKRTHWSLQLKTPDEVYRQAA